MLGLRELQRQFDAALRAPAAPDGPGWFTGPGLAVYRNNLREVARKALAADYAVIERLVGSDCFRQLAGDYLVAHPSRSGDLQHFGRAFPCFLDARYGDSVFPYFGDVARLERALTECGCSAAAPILDISALAGVDSLEYEALQFAPHPAWRLLASPYPIAEIWHANQSTAEPDRVINLASGAAYVIVRRHHGELLVQTLSRGEFEFLHALQNGHPLGAAFDLAKAIADSFDAAASMLHLFEWQLVSGIAVPGKACCSI